MTERRRGEGLTRSRGRTWSDLLRFAARTGGTGEGADCQRGMLLLNGGSLIIGAVTCMIVAIVMASDATGALRVAWIVLGAVMSAALASFGAAHWLGAARLIVAKRRMRKAGAMKAAHAEG
jgi:hypothetical protein